MNTLFKRFLTFAVAAVMALSFCFSASAASANKYGLGLNAQVQSGENGEAEISFELKNVNDFDVNNVSISPTVPLELQLAAAEPYFAETLEAGRSIEGSFVYAASALAQPASADSAEEKSPAKAVAAAIGCAVLFAVLAAAFIKIFKNKKAAAMVLALMLLVPIASVFGVHAIGTESLNSFSLGETVTLNGQEYQIELTVYYQANSAKQSYFEFETAAEKIPEENQTVTRLVTDFSGTAAAAGTVKSVSYSVTNELDGFEQAVTGEAELLGCEWNAQGLTLKDGQNKITFTALLDSGEQQTQTYFLNYDSGEIYSHRETEVLEDGGTKYIENVLNIYFETDTTDERINEILSNERVARIGEINGVVMVQARANVSSLDELRAKANEFYNYSEVVLAEIEEVLDIQPTVEAVSPSDPWYNNSSYSYSWSEALPAGNNWSAEAVQAPSAWGYDKYYSNVKVGVIDGGFYTAHEDYDSLVSFPSTAYQTGNDSTSQHGTHVAGIIGATANNGLGITGLLWDVDILGAAYTTGGSDTVANVISAVTAVVTAGAKAVNLSLGISYNADKENPYLSRPSDATLASTAGQCAVGMNSLLNQGLEFVVVQSAGNGTVDTRIGSDSKRSDNAYYNGLYCSVLNTRTYGTMSLNAVQNVYDRIIVVGAVQNLSSSSKGVYLPMWEYSNGGDRVDIYAPGKQVFSCIPDLTQNSTVYKYAYMTGTSQAAPIVTSVAGLCFAINPNLTGAQVKAIICDDANSAHVAYDYSLIHEGTGLDYHPFEGDGKVISMQLCAEAALRTVCGKASYTYLNLVVAEAQKLNPNDYTNYDTVQALIDSIDYNLYEFEQDKVSAKANEIIAALDKLEERGQADYTCVKSAIAQANQLDSNDYVDFSAVTAAINAVDYSKYADEQEEVDQMAQAILDAIAALELKLAVTSSQYDVVVDNSKKLIVMTTENFEDILTCLDAGGYTVSLEPNSFGLYSTGAAVSLINPSTLEISAVYYIAVVGDINGDGQVNGEDAFLASLYSSGIAEPSAELFAAVDADCSGEIDSEDIELLARVGLYADSITNSYIES